LAGQLWNDGKIELDPTSTDERLWQLFAIYGCNETEFSYVIFTQKWNFTTAERQQNSGNWALHTLKSDFLQVKQSKLKFTQQH